MSYMDHIETLSDCSESSKSESSSSDISTLSGLSEYQDEFLGLKQLINPEGSLPCKNGSADKGTVICWYQNQIYNLNIQLQNSLKQNENSKNDLYNLEKRKDILYGEKLEKLLKQNKQLEYNLLAANNQIERLIKIHRVKDNTDTEPLADKILYLEKSNQELTNQNYLLSNKINQCTFQKNEIKSECTSLKSEVNELKLELTAKINCVNELKKKISEQHVQLLEISQDNVKLSHSLDLITGELKHVTKSENWYKDELRQLQKEKSGLAEKKLENEKTLALQEEKIEQLKLELSNWKCTCDEIYLTALKEKEKILKQVEFTEKESTTSQHENVNLESITTYYDSVVNDLSADVAKFKSNFERQQKCFEHVSKEKTDLLAKYLLLQNCLKEKDNLIEEFESNVRHLKEKLSSAFNSQAEQNSKLLDVSKACAKLKIELSAKEEEIETFEKSIQTIKEQFKIFTSKYIGLRDELFKKNKEILHLQYEKQELCMDNNRKTCELKKTIEKDNEQIEQLKKTISELELLKKEVEFENNKQFQTIESLNNEIVKVQKDLFVLQTKLVNYERNTLESNNNLRTEVQEPTNLEVLKFSDAIDENATMSVYDHSEALDTTNTVNVLKSICYLFKISEDDNFVASYNQNGYIKILVNKIHSHVQFVESELSSKSNEVMELKKRLNKLKNSTTNRMEKLLDRCKELEARTEENSNVLKSFSSEKLKDGSLNDEVKHLRTLLEVKTREDKDKRKRYERNYRTLLRKVKEHMKGRNTAQKHNAYLQDLHNTLSDERNTLRLQLDLKMSEANELQKCVENYSNINEKFKLDVLRLQKELSTITPCTKCVDFELLTNQKGEVEKSLKNYENRITTNVSDLKLKEELLENLQQENQGLLLELSSRNAKLRENVTTIETLSKNNKELSAKLGDVEKMLTTQKSTNEHLRTEVINAHNSVATVYNEKEQLSRRLDDVTEKNVHLLQEVKHLNACLQLKSEEVNELHLGKERSVDRWLEKETNLLNLITDLKNQIQVFKSEIEIVKNEKFFLQRLCSDLKVALTVHVNHNKALRGYIEKLCKEREKIDNGSIILSCFPSPTKYDDGYIDKLLQENSMPLHDRPFCDIQDSLNTLKKEIVFLQKQIVEKNIV